MTVRLSGSTSGVVQDKKIEGTAWGLLFLWIGVVLLADVGWGIALLGIGAIILGAQAWRSHAGARVENFSLVLGGVFLITGVWDLLRLNVDLVPVLFILGGIALLVSSWKTRSPSHGVGTRAH